MINLSQNPSLPSFDWLQVLQHKNREAFLQRGFPTKREESWKYTDTSFLANDTWNWPVKIEQEISHSFACRMVFINGYFCSQQSNLPEGVIFQSLSKALASDSSAKLKEFFQQENIKKFPFLGLNTVLMGDGCYLYIPKNVVVKEPIHLLFINTNQKKFHISPRNFIFAEKNSAVTVIEEYRGEKAEHYVTNTTTLLQAEENSQIHYYKIQNEDKTSNHFANIFVSQQKNSQVNTFCFGLGGRFVREDLYVRSQGENCESTLTGLYHLIHDHQHLDNHLYVDHQASRCKSNMLYKGILENKSCAVFNGKVYVAKNTEKNHAIQTNHNLLLSSEAEINTKPELEIYADDIRCNHGATVGCLNSDEMFYLRSRGIAELEARQMLIRAFADEILQKVNHVAIQDYICSGVYAKLS